MKTIALQYDDIAWAVRRLPKEVRALLVRHGGKLFLAGGYLRSVIAREPVNDLDLFASSKDYAEACARELEGPRPKRKMFTTENAFTVFKRPWPVQFIHRWTFDNPQDAIASFDFTVAQAALWWDSDFEKWLGCCSERFYPDAAAKRLVYTTPTRNEAAGGSMLRTLKFYQRGYRIPLDSLGGVIARLVGDVDINKTGRPGLAKVITGLLREVDPIIDPNHMAHLPSSGEAGGEGRDADG